MPLEAASLVTQLSSELKLPLTIVFAWMVIMIMEISYVSSATINAKLVSHYLPVLLVTPSQETLQTYQTVFVNKVSMTTT